MNQDLEDFREFMKRREAAAKAYVSGDARALEEISALRGAATFFGPRGDLEQGAGAVVERYKTDVAAFEPGSETRFEVLHMEASGDVAYWVGLQRASARLKGKTEPVPFNLRVTEIFRREDGVWKLIHRHADELKIEPEAAA